LNVHRFAELIREIYAAVDELEEMFPGRHFTPDGHMVGSIGEAIAKFFYGATLHPPSHKVHDAVIGMRQVQIKVTQRSSISLSSEPDNLLVLRIFPDGSFSEEYSGPGRAVWELVSSKAPPKNNQYQIRLTKLREMQKLVPNHEKFNRLISMDDL
jgi:hypothetical protein